MFLLNSCATLLKFVQDCTQKRERDAEKEENWRNDIREDSNVRILYASEEIDREEKNEGE